MHSRQWPGGHSPGHTPHDPPESGSLQRGTSALPGAAVRREEPTPRGLSCPSAAVRCRHSPAGGVCVQQWCPIPQSCRLSAAQVYGPSQLRAVNKATRTRRMGRDRFMATIPAPTDGGSGVSPALQLMQMIDGSWLSQVVHVAANWAWPITWPTGRRRARHAPKRSPRTPMRQCALSLVTGLRWFRAVARGGVADVRPHTAGRLTAFQRDRLPVR